jgi:hypothetical protein
MRLFKSLNQGLIGRSFPRRADLTVEAADTLERALMHGNIPFDETDAGIKMCSQMSWLHTEAIGTSTGKTICYFLTRIHEK